MVEKKISIRILKNLLDDLIEQSRLTSRSRDFKEGKIFAYRLIKDHLIRLEE